ncbi:MAG: LysM peptidoglycan-binding domain-containing protein [Balneolaceae bacterium]|nr:LysM peptidoglycan-binding domain-containing protein [Balneolaceae bacterium]MCH8549404.1 LysM peptidoglycan-binding domain-containing protein [Balneolaceae bacterium]
MTLYLITISILLSFGGLAAAGTQPGETRSSKTECQPESELYVVQPGDFLLRVASHYGSSLFWEAIYVANADRIVHPDLIYSGQELKIPGRIAAHRDSGDHPDSVLLNPFCDVGSLPLDDLNSEHLSLYSLDDLNREFELAKAEETEPEAVKEIEPDEETLQAFREAFEALVYDDQDQAELKEEEQQSAELQMLMEIDGMVLDETRSKIGSDFYDVFYSNWQAPEGASHYTIRVLEQPAPSLGTIVSVEVNSIVTFRMRLQPRYDMIREAGEFAVRQTHQALQGDHYQVRIY